MQPYCQEASVSTSLPWDGALPHTTDMVRTGLWHTKQLPSMDLLKAGNKNTQNTQIKVTTHINPMHEL